MKAHLSTCFLLCFLQAACTPAEPYESPSGSGGATAGGATGGANTGGGTSSENLNGTEAGKDFFEGQLVAAFRSSSENCLSCHNRPASITGSDPSDQSLYDYGEMFSLLKVGGFSNDNNFINPMLGKDDHPGSEICSDASDDLCQKAIEWFDLEFPGVGSRFGYVDQVDISFDGINVSGKAQDVNNPDEPVTIRAYLDGEAGTGTMVGEGTTRTVNNSFNFRLEDSVRDNGDHDVYLYAIVNGQEEPLGGNPMNFMAFRPRGEGTFPGTNTVIPQFTGCGCHDGGFSYSALWPDLTIPIGGRDGANAKAGVKASARNNYLIDMATGDRGAAHPGGRVGNVTAIANWWCAEFDPDNAQCSNQ